MSSRKRIAVAALVALGVVAVAGCAKTDLSNLTEGQLFDIGKPVSLRYNVVFTRFLNPAQTEDSEYVVGQPPVPPGKRYLATFLLITNSTEHPVALPTQSDFKIFDTTGATYKPLQSSSPFAFPFGQTIAPHMSVPAPDSVAADGPTQGSMLLFLVDNGVTENRPLKLDVTAGGQTATVQLDL